MKEPNPILVFDRALLRQRRNRAAPHFSNHSVLSDETAVQLIDRLGDIKRDFKSVLWMGSKNEDAEAYLQKRGCEFLALSDISENMLRHEHWCSPPLARGVRGGVGGSHKENPSPTRTKLAALVKSSYPLPQGERNDVVLDEEFLPFAPSSFDLVIGNFNLHLVNDLPGTLSQIRNILRPDGLFLAAFPGGKTLQELRTCLMEAELAVTGGVSPRLFPTIELQTASGLLQRAGFSLPVVDSEILTLTYDGIFALMDDLSGMGETNIQMQRLRHPTRRSVFLEASRLYEQRFEEGAGRISATFEILFLHGWK